MPMPIMPVNTDSFSRQEIDSRMPTVDYGIDVSMLPFLVDKQSQGGDLVKVSNFEAGVLFRLWRDGGKTTEEGNFLIPPTISNSDILRLKASGLISGDTENFQFTLRGKKVIETLVLAENNTFDKDAKTKSLQEIVADNKKRLGTKPRLALGRK